MFLGDWVKLVGLNRLCAVSSSEFDSDVEGSPKSGSSGSDQEDVFDANYEIEIGLNNRRNHCAILWQIQLLLKIMILYHPALSQNVPTQAQHLDNLDDMNSTSMDIDQMLLGHSIKSPIHSYSSDCFPTSKQYADPNCKGLFRMQRSY